MLIFVVDICPPTPPLLMSDEIITLVGGGMPKALILSALTNRRILQFFKESKLYVLSRWRLLASKQVNGSVRGVTSGDGLSIFADYQI